MGHHSVTGSGVAVESWTGGAGLAVSPLLHSEDRVCSSMRQRDSQKETVCFYIAHSDWLTSKPRLHLNVDLHMNAAPPGPGH